jgi:hypothetical protein
MSRTDMPADLRSATPDEQFTEVTRASVDLHVKEELLAKLRRSYEERRLLHVKTVRPQPPDSTQALPAAHPMRRPDLATTWCS